MYVSGHMIMTCIPSPTTHSATTGLMRNWNTLSKVYLRFQLGDSTSQGWETILQDLIYTLNQDQWKPYCMYTIWRIHGSGNQEPQPWALLPTSQWLTWGFCFLFPQLNLACIDPLVTRGGILPKEGARVQLNAKSQLPPGNLYNF